jgi:hypothetical protein
LRLLARQLWRTQDNRYYKSEGTNHMLFAFLAVSPISTVIVIAVALIGLLIWGVWHPLVWRLFAVLGMGAGGGFLVWGIMMAALKEEPPFASPAGIIGIGAGVLIASIALLVISFCGGCTKRKG